MVLGSLYKGKISLEFNNVISIVATATHFLLEEIIQKCEKFMSDTMNIKTVMLYYEAAELYCLKDVKADAKKWLELGFFIEAYENYNILKQISPEMMYEIVTSPDFVVWNEFELYKMLKNW